LKEASINVRLKALFPLFLKPTKISTSAPAGIFPSLNFGKTVEVETSGDEERDHNQSDCSNSRSNTYFFKDQHQSNTNNFYGFNTEPEILPTTWSGKFQLDPNDVRIKQERNQSDVRDYADHRNFVVKNDN